MKANGHGVELTCEVLREQGVAVTSRSYRERKTRAAATRTCSDAVVVDKRKSLSLRDVKGCEQPEILYGRRKMTAWLARSGYERNYYAEITDPLKSEAANKTAA